MRHALCCFLLMGTVICAAPSGAARSELSVIASSDRLLVRDCEALFGADVFTGDTDQEMRRAARQEAAGRREAQRRLSHVPPWALRHRLSPYLHRLPVASRAYAGVAYTLAYFNIDTAGNIRRLGQTLSAPGADFSVADTIPTRVDTLYRRHPSDAVLREYLSLRSDAHIQEELDSLRGPVFCTILERRSVLRRSIHRSSRNCSSHSTQARSAKTPTLCGVQSGRPYGDSATTGIPISQRPRTPVSITSERAKATITCHQGSEVLRAELMPQSNDCRVSKNWPRRCGCGAN